MNATRTSDRPSLFGIQTTGYRSLAISADVLLGSINSLDYILWVLAFAAVIFQGALTAYLPLASMLLLLSTAAICGIIGLTSKIPMSFAGQGGQGAIILGLVAVLLNEHISEFYSGSAAAATMFSIMALSSVAFSVCLFLSAQFHLGRVIQAIPFPVLCGYLAGTGWLFIEAGVSMMSGVDFDVGLNVHLHTAADTASMRFVIPHMGAYEILVFDALIRWLPALVAGAVIFLALRFKKHWLVTPLCLVVVAATFYAFAYWQGIPIEQLRATGWIFQVGSAPGGGGLASLDFSHIQWRFVVGVLPEIITIVAMTLLTTGISLSAMEAGTDIPISFSQELRSHGAANLGSAIFLGMPGATEDTVTIMAKRMGGSSRFLPLTGCALFILAAFAGSSVISYVPKVVMGALVFFAAIDLFYDYLYEACRRLSRIDAATVWIVFGGIVLFDYVPAVLVGLAITCILFIVHYSKIDVIHSTHLLHHVAGVAERPETGRRLEQLGGHSRLFNLQGYLFFGTASTFFDEVRVILEKSSPGSYFIFDFGRVIGIDFTAAQIIARMFKLLDGKQIVLICCAIGESPARTLQVAHAMAESDCTVLLSIDLALRWVEDALLVVDEATSGPPIRSSSHVP